MWNISPNDKCNLGDSQQVPLVNYQVCAEGPSACGTMGCATPVPVVTLRDPHVGLCGLHPTSSGESLGAGPWELAARQGAPAPHSLPWLRWFFARGSPQCRVFVLSPTPASTPATAGTRPVRKIWDNQGDVPSGHSGDPPPPPENLLCRTRHLGPGFLERPITRSSETRHLAAQRGWHRHHFVLQAPRAGRWWCCPLLVL